MEKECKYHGLVKHNGNKCSKCSTEAVQIHRWKMKEKALKYKGNKCSQCGYDKCSSALEFHHENENEKEFSISHTNAKWDLLKQELDKCILVCANCHREIHYKQNESKKAEVLKRREIIRLSQTESQIPKRKCNKCDNLFQPKTKEQIFCCKACTRKVDRPQKEVLIEELKTSNYSQLARKYGVSDNAIRKWIK